MLARAAIPPTHLKNGRRAVPRSTTSRPRWLPVSAVLAAAACWGAQGIGYAAILDRVPVDGLTVVTLRAVTAAVVVWGWLALADPGALAVPRRDLALLAVLGLVSVAIFYPALFFAYAWTGVAVATVLLYLSPAMVAIGAAVALRERLTRRKAVAVLGTLLGCALVVELDWQANLSGSASGIGIGVVAAASYATYSILGKPLLARHRIATVLAWYLLFGAVFLLAAKMVVSPASWPAPGDALAIGIYTGALTTVVPVALYSYGLSRLPSSEASILLTFEPVVAIALASALLGEALRLPQWLGVGAVLAGVVLMARPIRIRSNAGRSQSSSASLATPIDDGELSPLEPDLLPSRAVSR